ncbi:hypothetical protein D1632_10830 [Chryseobacterium nematophagum]|uniref:Phage portal protein n=1 Tax=Chryseobacterium nematophagum TaxID=2305228 RepID=A0A3M7LDB9_9FLAO|nr:hypothetical protein [Chryseobacterium nematophagum]RMZ60075.1 hypothetical protein D1632_10830 [Chryseobacterium nematophagum]
MGTMSDKGKRKSLRASNIEMQSRDISVSSYDDHKIYSRDYDNLYPLRIEKAINNSPTAKRCANLMAKYIAGQGIGKENDFIVNSKGETINDLIDLGSVDLAYQYGVFFHQSYKLDVEHSVEGYLFQRAETKILDYVPMARSKEDDDGCSGKYYFLKFQEKEGKFSKTDDKTIWYYPYNSDPKVILAQMQNDCKLAEVQNPNIEDLVRNYRGQVYYLNMTPKYPYALPLSDVVYDDMDSEYRIGRYTNDNVRNGWLGKVMIIKYDNDEQENERAEDSFDEVLKDNVGAENASNVLVISVPMSSTDDVSKAFRIEQVKAQYDDKLFESTVKTLRQNIMGVFNNPPEILVFAGSGALFGPNSETYIEAKKFYWEQNERERSKLEKALTLLLGIPISFTPIKGVETQQLVKQERNELSES